MSDAEVELLLLDRLGRRMTAGKRPALPQRPPPNSALSPSLKRAFLALENAQQRVAALEGAAREPIAVIGSGCRVPGADNPEAFWCSDARRGRCDRA